MSLWLLSAALAVAGSFESKPFGVLLLGQGGDKAWDRQLELVGRRFGKVVPWEFAGGEADQKAIQKAVERLEAQKVRKLVVVPLYLSSNSDLMDQTRFLFGIREYPSAQVVGRGTKISRRVTTKKPVVLAQALDDHALVAEVLASRALSLSRDAKKETLLLVAQPPAGKEQRAQHEQLVSALAERVRARAGLAAARGALLDDKELKKKARGALVVAHALSPGEAERAVPRALSGVFMRFNGRNTLLPDERIAAWIEQSVGAAAALPDMRQFKDAGRAVERDKR